MTLDPSKLHILPPWFRPPLLLEWHFVPSSFTLVHLQCESLLKHKFLATLIVLLGVGQPEALFVSFLLWCSFVIRNLP